MTELLKDVPNLENITFEYLKGGEGVSRELNRNLDLDYAKDIFLLLFQKYLNPSVKAALMRDDHYVILRIPPQFNKIFGILPKYLGQNEGGFEILSAEGFDDDYKSAIEFMKSIIKELKSKGYRVELQWQKNGRLDDGLHFDMIVYLR